MPRLRRRRGASNSPETAGSSTAQLWIGPPVGPPVEVSDSKLKDSDHTKLAGPASFYVLKFTLLSKKPGGQQYGKSSVCASAP